MNQLRTFLNQNLTYREHFLKHKLFFDAQLEFAKHNRRLLIYEPEYDQDGFDLIFDDLLYHKHFQVKSILKPAKTSDWQIHRALLRPHLRDLNNYPASPDSFGVGYGGGVLLIYATINQNDSISTSYFFTDGLIISALQLGILKYKNPKNNKSAINCAEDLFNPYEIGGKIKITKSCFLNFFCLADLFAYCGFSIQNKSGSDVRFRLNKAVARNCGRAEKIDRKILPEKWRKFIYDDFLDIVDLSKFISPEESLS